MDGDSVAPLWGRPSTHSHLFNFHPEQDEIKSMRVKDRSSSVIAIRAAVLREPGRALRIEKLEMEGPREHEVLVRLVASGICHTDIDFSDSGEVGPAILGHEGAGVVERLGRSVKGVQVGGAPQGAPISPLLSNL